MLFHQVSTLLHLEVSPVLPFQNKLVYLCLCGRSHHPLKSISLDLPGSCIDFNKLLWDYLTIASIWSFGFLPIVMPKIDRHPANVQTLTRTPVLCPETQSDLFSPGSPHSLALAHRAMTSTAQLLCQVPTFPELPWGISACEKHWLWMQLCALNLAICLFLSDYVSVRFFLHKMH